MFDTDSTNTLANVAITRFHIISYVGVMKKQLRQNNHHPPVRQLGWRERGADDPRMRGILSRNDCGSTTLMWAGLTAFL